MRPISLPSLRTGVTLLLIGLLAACRGGIEVGSEYRPPVDYQSSAHQGINYESDLMACQAVSRQVPADQQAWLGSGVGTGVGAAAGATAGALIGGITAVAAAATGYGIGAAVGASGAALLGMTDQVQIITDCMGDRGYAVLP